MAKSKTLSAQVPVANLENAHVETVAVRAGQIRSPELEHSEAIFPTSSFVFNSASEAAARFAGEAPGNIYSRFTNPTIVMFEERIAAMEGGERAVATASGMAAIMSTAMALLGQGDHIVCSRSVFGTTNVFFEKYMSKFGVSMTFVDVTDYDQWEAAITPTTRILFLETPTNPLCEVADIARLAEIAHRGNALLVVDNCFCTPVLQRPFEFGADIVIHSATKYLDGQGRCLGGVVVGPAVLIEEIHGFLRSAGPTMSPFNAWVFLKGLETLAVRMQAHCNQALEIASWLEAHAGVERVYYAGLASHPGHKLAVRQQSGFSGVLSFELQGGKETAWKFIDGVEFISITANLGDTKSTITHPASTTHGRLSAEARAKAGISDKLIRISVGLEHITDIKLDLEKGFRAAGL
jgi:O-succinylhomoserine sulfhydrylase